MDIILFFHTSQRQSWRKELDGAYRFARARDWRVQVIEPRAKSVPVHQLLDLWNPVGCLVECSGAPSDYFDVALFSNIPTVFIGRDPRTLPESASFMNPSSTGPGLHAAKELLLAGFRSFGFVSTPDDFFWSRDREAEFRKTLKTNGYACATFGRHTRFRTAEDRTSALKAWLKALPKPCGIMAENDYLASEVLDIAAKIKISSPDKLAVIGVDNDSSLCDNAKPTLSSVYLDFEQAGYRASEILSTLVANPKASPIRETYSALGLMRRGSTPAGSGTPPRIAKALSYIREKACEGICAADVARQLPGSRRLAEIDFHRATGRSILEEIQRVRFERVELLLKNRCQQLGAIAAQCGWKTENALRSMFLKRYGMSMRQWRQQQTQSQ